MGELREKPWYWELRGDAGGGCGGCGIDHVSSFVPRRLINAIAALIPLMLIGLRRTITLWEVASLVMAPLTRFSAF